MSVFGRDIVSVAIRIENNGDALTDMVFPEAAIDSRSMPSGAVFFAVRGERRDGHDFVVDTSRRAGMVIADEKWWNEVGTKQRGEIVCPIAIVSDTVKALGELARLHRRKFSIPVIAITGSSGKTTTKDMIVQILEKKYKTHHTRGNFNNHLGLPLTIFTLETTDEVSVLEIGTNHPGEIEYLCSIAEPTHGIITNVGKGHIGFFDSIKDIAREKGMLFRWIERDDRRVAFVNADDERIVSQAKSLRNVVRYGLDRDDVDITARIGEEDETGRYQCEFRTRNNDGPYTVKLPIGGKHNVRNALAAATVGIHLGVSPALICEALQNFTPPSKRNIVQKINGLTVVDDTYNANPDSMQAALEMFRSMKVPGKKILILGDMLELGSQSGEEHGRIGLMVPDMGFEYVFTFGKESEALFAASSVPFGGHYDDKNKLLDDLMDVLGEGDALLVKGSRGMKMEEIIEGLVQRLRVHKK
jgi:UDP-N-acetylmuramoyl-tripeptide--D-alanyl-D-alanine ligase